MVVSWTPLSSSRSSFSSSSLFFFFFSKGVGCCCSVPLACPNPNPLPDPGAWHWVTGRPLRSQLVTVSAEDGVACLAGCQLLERALWRTAGCFSARLLLREEIGFETNGQILPPPPKKSDYCLRWLTCPGVLSVGSGPWWNSRWSLPEWRSKTNCFSLPGTLKTQKHMLDINHLLSNLRFVQLFLKKQTKKNP